MKKRFKKYIEICLMILLSILLAIILTTVSNKFLFTRNGYVIGDVVELTDVGEPVMIIGYCQEESVSSRVYDYVGVSYPDGYLGSSYNYLFDEDDIVRYYRDVNRKTLKKRKEEIQNWSVIDDNEVESEEIQ